MLARCAADRRISFPPSSHVDKRNLFAKVRFHVWKKTELKILGGCVLLLSQENVEKVDFICGVIVPGKLRRLWFRKVAQMNESLTTICF